MRIARLALFLIIFWGASSFTHATNIYPEWFLFPQKYNNLIVGYSYNGMPAMVDAESMYCAFQECIVMGTLEVYENSSINDMLKNSDYFYYFSPQAVEKIRNRLYPVDQFDINIMTHDYISAFSIDSAVSCSAPRIKVENLNRPEWLEKTFSSDRDYYYGVGIYTALGNENDGWKTAEEQAIFTILTNLAVQVHRVNVVSDGSELKSGQAAIEQISFIKVKYLLQNIEVMERFPDRENKLYYVLLRIPVNGIRSPFLR
jgi:hypothetical protein